MLISFSLFDKITALGFEPFTPHWHFNNSTKFIFDALKFKVFYVSKNYSLIFFCRTVMVRFSFSDIDVSIVSQFGCVFMLYSVV